MGPGASGPSVTNGFFNKNLKRIKGIIAFLRFQKNFNCKYRVSILLYSTVLMKSKQKFCQIEPKTTKRPVREGVRFCFYKM